MKATIDRDETKPVITSYNAKTISLSKARALRTRPPDLTNKEEGLGIELGSLGIPIADIGEEADVEEADVEADVEEADVEADVEDADVEEADVEEADADAEEADVEDAEAGGTSINSIPEEPESEIKEDTTTTSTTNTSVIEGNEAGEKAVIDHSLFEQPNVAQDGKSASGILQVQAIGIVG